MQGFNHVAGGFAFTGIFASFADVNIYQRADLMAVTWIASVLPDIDHTKSGIGKAAYPLAHWLSRKFGHRTITHSVFFYAAVVCLVRLSDLLWRLDYTLPVALALGSHLIFDMCTRQGVPIFYPFSKRPAVLPANPKMRLSAMDIRSEAIVFVLFCCLNLFAYPLMAQGFWTTYNKSFMTFDHLRREQLRKPGDYAVTLFNGGDTIRGDVYTVSTTKIVLFRAGKFTEYELNKSKLLDFRRLPTRHVLKEVNLFQVTLDSLNWWMQQPVVKITAQSEKELYYYQGSILKKGKEVTMDYPNQIKFHEIARDNRELKIRLAQIREEEERVNRDFAEKSWARIHLMAQLRQQQELKTTSDYEEGKRIEAIMKLERELENHPRPIRPDLDRYFFERKLIELELEANDLINAQLLVWQAQQHLN